MKRTPLLHILVLTIFSLNSFGILPIALAQESAIVGLSTPGVRVGLSPEFNPPILKGVKVYKNNPLRFDFILDQADGVHSSKEQNQEEALKQETTNLIKYFLISLTVPEDELWVNLSPYEKNRIIPQVFGQTEMGRDMLAQDYVLKQITASLIYPEEKTGKEFWAKVYQAAQEKFGTTQLPINTFNKVWVVPEKAVVYENGTTAYVTETKLKVMLEEDYLSLEKNVEKSKARNFSLEKDKKGINAIGSQIVREIVIPELTREVNEGKNFAKLRQIYHSVILADWYRKRLKASILNKIYSDQNKTAGAKLEDKETANKIWAQYVKSFKKGVFNYIKEDVITDPLSKKQGVFPRKYFSGGLGFDSASLAKIQYNNVDNAMSFQEAKDAVNGAVKGALKVVGVRLDPATSSSANPNAGALPAGSIPINSILEHLESLSLKNGGETGLYQRTLKALYLFLLPGADPNIFDGERFFARLGEVKGISLSELNAFIDKRKDADNYKSALKELDTLGTNREESIRSGMIKADQLADGIHELVLQGNKLLVIRVVKTLLASITKDLKYLAVGYSPQQGDVMFVLKELRKGGTVSLNDIEATVKNAGRANEYQEIVKFFKNMMKGSMIMRRNTGSVIKLKTEISTPLTSEEQQINKNVESFLSKEFRDVLSGESIGGNAGRNNAAVNGYADAQGNILFWGNVQDVRKEIEDYSNQLKDRGGIFEITIKVKAFNAKPGEKQYSLNATSTRFSPQARAKIEKALKIVNARLDADLRAYLGLSPLEAVVESDSRFKDQNGFTAKERKSLEQRETNSINRRQKLIDRTLPLILRFGDQHGKSQDLKSVVEDVKKALKAGRRVIVNGIGDTQDRGPDNVGVFEALEELKRLEASNPLLEVHLLWGNHDQLLVDAVFFAAKSDEDLQARINANGPDDFSEGSKSYEEAKYYGRASTWRSRNGGTKTEDQFQNSPRDIKELALFMLENLELFYVNENGKIAVHAGFPVDKEGNLLISRERLNELSSQLTSLKANLIRARLSFEKRNGKISRINVDQFLRSEGMPALLEQSKEFLRDKDVYALMWTREDEMIDNLRLPGVDLVENFDEIINKLREAGVNEGQLEKYIGDPTKMLRGANYVRSLIGGEVKAKTQGVLDIEKTQRMLQQLGPDIAGIEIGHIHYGLDLDGLIKSIDVGEQEQGYFVFDPEIGNAKQPSSVDGVQPSLEIEASIEQLIKREEDEIHRVEALLGKPLMVFEPRSTGAVDPLDIPGSMSMTPSPLAPLKGGEAIGGKTIIPKDLDTKTRITWGEGNYSIDISAPKDSEGRIYLKDFRIRGQMAETFFANGKDVEIVLGQSEEVQIVTGRFNKGAQDGLIVGNIFYRVAKQGENYYLKQDDLPIKDSYSVRRIIKNTFNGISITTTDATESKTKVQYIPLVDANVKARIQQQIADKEEQFEISKDTSYGNIYSYILQLQMRSLDAQNPNQAQDTRLLKQTRVLVSAALKQSTVDEGIGRQELDTDLITNATRAVSLFDVYMATGSHVQEYKEAVDGLEAVLLTPKQRASSVIVRSPLLVSVSENAVIVRSPLSTSVPASVIPPSFTVEEKNIIIRHNLGIIQQAMKGNDEGFFNFDFTTGKMSVALKLAVNTSHIRVKKGADYKQYELEGFKDKDGIIANTLKVLNIVSEKAYFEIRGLLSQLNDQEKTLIAAVSVIEFNPSNGNLVSASYQDAKDILSFTKSISFTPKMVKAFVDRVAEFDSMRADYIARRVKGEPVQENHFSTAFGLIWKLLEQPQFSNTYNGENGALNTLRINKNKKEILSKIVNLSSVDNAALGGIDLSSGRLNVEIQNQGGELNFDIDSAELANANIEGFVPVIISIQPLKDFVSFWGAQAGAQSPQNSSVT